MAGEILFTTALDKSENLIHIDNAEKGKSYYCPVCKGDFILRRSGKTGKGTKRPHFAHKNITTNCTPEGVLHLSFKKQSIDILDRYISENIALKISWNCTTCSKRHQGNLLENIAFVKEEYDLKVCRPDIALLDAQENVIAVIEIVVTHLPEEHVRRFYEENDIVLIQINLSSDEDLNNVHRIITDPGILNYCFHPYCPSYNGKSISRKIIYNRERCGICFHGDIIKFFIEVNSIFGKLQHKDFTNREIEIVKSKVPQLTIKTDKSNNENYPVTICNRCRGIRRSNRPRRF